MWCIHEDGAVKYSMKNKVKYFNILYIIYDILQFSFWFLLCRFWVQKQTNQLHRLFTGCSYVVCPLDGAQDLAIVLLGIADVAQPLRAN